MKHTRDRGATAAIVAGIVMSLAALAAIACTTKTVIQVATPTVSAAPTAAASPTIPPATQAEIAFVRWSRGEVDELLRKTGAVVDGVGGSDRAVTQAAVKALTDATDASKQQSAPSDRLLHLSDLMGVAAADCAFAAALLDLVMSDAANSNQDWRGAFKECLSALSDANAAIPAI